MAGPCGNRILGVLPAIHVDDAVVPRVAELMQPVDVGEPFRRVRGAERPWIRIAAQRAHWQTTRIWLVLPATLVPELTRPGKQWKLPLKPAVAADVFDRAAAHPWTRQIDFAIGQTRNRPGVELRLRQHRAARIDERDPAFDRQAASGRRLLSMRRQRKSGQRDRERGEPVHAGPSQLATGRTGGPIRWSLFASGRGMNFCARPLLTSARYMLPS